MKTLRWMVRTALLVGAVLVSGSLQAVETVSVPIETVGRTPLVDVILNGRGPYRFVLGTGTSGSFISRELAQELKILPAGSRSGAGPVSTPQTIRARTLELGELSWERKELRVLDEPFLGSQEGNPRGQLGLSLFGSYLLTLDLPNQVLRLEKGSLPAPDGKEILSYEARALESWPEAGDAPHVNIRLGDLTLAATLDPSGMSGLALHERYENKLDFESEPAKVGAIITERGRFDIRGAKLQSRLHIGGYEVESPNVWISGGFAGAQLGHEILSRFSLTLDQVNHRIRVQEPKGSISPWHSRAARIPELGGTSSLKANFNQDQGKVRLLLILSPT